MIIRKLILGILLSSVLPTTILLGTVAALVPHQAVQNWALVVAGTKGEGDTLKKQEDLQTAEAYQCLLDRSYQADHVYFVSINASRPGVDNSTSKATVQYAITTWLKDRSDGNDVIFMYFLDHGNINVYGEWYFCVGGTTPATTITGGEFMVMLSTLNCGKLFFVIEACYSGALIEWLSDPNRIIMTATDAFTGSANSMQPPYLPIFSHNFFSALSQMKTVGTAFNIAWQAVKDSTRNQHPLLDDNADEVGHEGPMPNGGDGTIAFSVPWLPGDITADGVIDIFDIVVIATAYGSTPSSPKWNPSADLNGDYVINSVDLSMASGNMGYPE